MQAAEPAARLGLVMTGNIGSDHARRAQALTLAALLALAG